MFHYGEELHILAHRAHELVHTLALTCAAVIDGAQRVVFNAIDGHHLKASHHAVKGGLPSTVMAVGIVYLLGAIKRKADEEVVLAEEVAPIGIDEQAIGLERVLNLFGATILVLQGHGFFVEVDACKQWLSSVPAEGHGRNLYGLNVLADITLQQLVAHLGLSASVEVGLAEIVAVVAIEITQRAHGLYHCGKGRGTC